MSLDISHVIVSLLSIVFGGIIGHYLAKIRQKEAALIKAKNDLDILLFKEKQVIKNGKRESDEKFYSAFTKQEIAYRNLDRCLNMFKQRNIRNKWSLYKDTINKNPTSRSKLAIEPEPGEIYYENKQDVLKCINILLEAIK